MNYSMVVDELSRVAAPVAGDSAVHVLRMREGRPVNRGAFSVTRIAERSHTFLEDGFRQFAGAAEIE